MPTKLKGISSVDGSTVEVIMNEEDSGDSSKSRSKVALYSGPVKSLNSGDNGSVDVDTFVEGEELLDYSDKFSMVLLEDGTYAVTATVSPSSNLTVGSTYSVNLLLGDQESYADAIAATGNLKPLCTVSLTWFVSSELHGRPVGVFCINQGAQAKGFFLKSLAICKLL